MHCCCAFVSCQCQFEQTQQQQQQQQRTLVTSQWNAKCLYTEIRVNKKNNINNFLYIKSRYIVDGVYVYFYTLISRILLDFTFINFF